MADTLFICKLMSQVNHYEILGVQSSATNSDLKRAYRDLVKRYHPDINPAAEAKDKIRLINEAYEVLSEHYSRAAYDMLLSGAFETPTYKPPEETEAEKYRREYLRKKAHQDRVNLENLMKIKIKFYRFQRMVCYLFFASGILFTIDYYYAPTQVDADITSMNLAFRQTELKLGEWILSADRGFFDEYQKNGGTKVTVNFSSIFEIPTSVRLEGSSSKYDVSGTLHSFGNILTIIVLIFSGIVIRHKEYSDFRLTAGIVPGFLVPFMFLMALLGG